MSPVERIRSDHNHSRLDCENPPSRVQKACDRHVQGYSYRFGKVGSDNKHTKESGCCQIISLRRRAVYFVVEKLLESASMYAKHESDLDVLATIRRPDPPLHGNGLIIDGLWPIHQKLLRSEGS